MRFSIIVLLLGLQGISPKMAIISWFIHIQQAWSGENTDDILLADLILSFWPRIFSRISRKDI